MKVKLCSLCLLLSTVFIISFQDFRATSDVLCSGNNINTKSKRSKSIFFFLYFAPLRNLKMGVKSLGI